MTPALLLFIYCVPIFAASLLGGWIPQVVRLTHRSMQIAISFVAGVILGVGLLHLLPHGYFELGSIESTMTWVLFGFLFMFFLERFFHFHHHDAPEEIAKSAELGSSGSAASGSAQAHAKHDPHHGHAHDHSHDHGDHAHAPAMRRLTWIGAAIGLTLHSAVDGLALAAAVTSEPQDAGAATRWAGLGVFGAILLHKPFDSLTIVTLMAAQGRSASSRYLLNFLYALVMPLGVFLFFWTIGPTSGVPHASLGKALSFAAGAFLCIATSDLLPELQFHHHDRGKLSAALLLGVALAQTIVYFESASHGPHGHVHEHGAHAEESGHAGEHSEAHEHDADHKDEHDHVHP